MSTMASSSGILWPYLTENHPEDGFQHFAQLQNDLNAVEACLESNKAQAIPKYLFGTILHSFKELGRKIDLKDESGKDGAYKKTIQFVTNGIGDCASSKSELGKLLDGTGTGDNITRIDGILCRLSQNSMSMSRPTKKSRPTVPNFFNSPHERTFTILVDSIETSHPIFGDLESGFESAARFLASRNSTHLPALEKAEDIKSIQWNDTDPSAHEKLGLLIECRTPEIANEAIMRGLWCTSERLYSCRKHKKVCSNCYAIGHSIKICKRPVRCGKCAENHETIQCKAVIRKCAICGGPHASGACRILEEVLRHAKTFVVGPPQPPSAPRSYISALNRNHASMRRRRTGELRAKSLMGTETIPQFI